MKEKTVMVSGCFICYMEDILRFKTAASYGKLYVSLGQDNNILRLKGKAPYFSEKERQFIV